MISHRQAAFEDIQEWEIPVYQPSTDKLKSTSWGEGTIEVANKVPYERSETEQVTPEMHRQTYYPFYFQGLIFPKEGRASLEEIHVHPSMRKKGIAKELVESFTALCKQYGVKRIEGVSYRTAVDFWEHMGWSKDRDKSGVNYVHRSLARRADLLPAMDKKMRSEGLGLRVMIRVNKGSVPIVEDIKPIPVDKRDDRYLDISQNVKWALDGAFIKFKTTDKPKTMYAAVEHVFKQFKEQGRLASTDSELRIEEEGLWEWEVWLS